MSTAPAFWASLQRNPFLWSPCFRNPVLLEQHEYEVNLYNFRVPTSICLPWHYLVLREKTHSQRWKFTFLMRNHLTVSLDALKESLETSSRGGPRPFFSLFRTTFSMTCSHFYLLGGNCYRTFWDMCIDSQVLAGQTWRPRHRWSGHQLANSELKEEFEELKERMTSSQLVKVKTSVSWGSFLSGPNHVLFLLLWF